MTLLLAVLIAVILLDCVRMRRRLGALPSLTPSDEPVASDHLFFTAPGVVLSDVTRRAASAWARAQHLDVVDLVPGQLPAIRALSVAQIIDPEHVRRVRFAPGVTAGHAILVDAAVAKRAGLTGPVADEVALIRMAQRLKCYASGSYAVALAPAEQAKPIRFERRLAIVRATLGPMTWLALALQPVFWMLLALGTWHRPLLGFVAIGLWHGQPLLTLVGTAIRARDLLLVTVLRAPIEIGLLLVTVLGRWKPPAPATPVEDRRLEYQRLLADGVDRFFEPRRTTCPVCNSKALRVHGRCGDLLQHKPGQFTLEKCDDCRHIFQNPRLSLAGLDFYYKDFYDGLGESAMEYIFSQSSRSYVDRARMVAEVGTPSRWLDVGAGHGHFCCIAQDAMPDTHFDGLDFSESIDEAHRRGWIERAYRGLFPDIAPSLAGTYDAVSMSHYLEHTLDPRLELEAAHLALAPKGHLLIEVPDPEFVLGRVLGTLWMPWFQPQHQHFLSVSNLERLLREQGFEPIAWHRGSAHTPIDFFAAVWLGLGRIAPQADVPWRSGGALARAWRTAVWTAGSPLLFAGWLTDRISAPILRRSSISNTYRVLAKRAPNPTVLS